MADVISIGATQGSLLATVSLWRQPDGSIRAVLDHMPVHVIEVRETIAERFVQAAIWTCEGANDFLRQASRFDDRIGEIPEDHPHVTP